MKEKTNRKNYDHKKILSVLKDNKKDKEANSAIDEALNRDIVKLSRVYTNLNKEEILGFVLTFSSDYSDIILSTVNGIMETLYYSCECGDISDKRQIDKETCDIVNKIICGRLGLEYNKENEWLHKQNYKEIEEGSLDEVIENKLYYYKSLLNRFDYEKSDEDSHNLINKITRNSFIKKSKIYISLNKEIREIVLGYILTLDCEYSDVIFDTENKIIRTTLRYNKYREDLYGREINGYSCKAIADFISEKYKIDKDRVISKLS